MPDDPNAPKSNGEPRYHLAVFDDHLRSLPLIDGTLLIGRSKSNHIQLQDDLLSRKHCSLTVSGGRVTLVDLNSSNGTFVNGVRVGTRELAPDDLVELGRTVMVLYDGTSWGRGSGLMNLRNPVKAQELVQRLKEGGVGLEKSARPIAPGPSDRGVRPMKGLSDVERAFFRWLECSESRLLPELVTDYLTHKLVSLLVRNSTPVRSAFTAVFEEMLHPQFFQRFGDAESLRAAVRERVERELTELRAEPEVHDVHRDLLEPVDSPAADSEAASESGDAEPAAPSRIPIPHGNEDSPAGERGEGRNGA